MSSALPRSSGSHSIAANSPVSRSGLSPETLADFLAEVGRTLLASGCPSYRLEDVIAAIAGAEGVEAQALAHPTSLIVAIRESASAPPLLRLVRVKQPGLNLDSLVSVDEVLADVAASRITIAEARGRLGDIARRRPPYPSALGWLALAAASGASAIFLGGDGDEVAVAAATGSVVGLFAWGLGKVQNARFLVEFAGGFVAAALASVASFFDHGLSREVVVLAGVIALIPGMTLTTALAELSHKSVVCGAGRLMEALVGFTSILFGIALEVGIQRVADLPPAVSNASWPLHWQALALIGSSLAFAVRGCVPKRYLGAALASGAIGYIATAAGRVYLPRHIAAFAAAMAVCSTANGLARITGRPAQLFQLPGLMLLVPGSFGFLSLESFLLGDVHQGAAEGSQMLLVAIALVTGILLSNVVVPAQKYF